MITTNTNAYILSTKPFFMPWQNANISYDALLGLSFTLMSGITGTVYLTTYIKSQNRLIIGFDLHVINDDKSKEIIPIVREDVPINKGLSLVTFKERLPYFLAGNITIIDTTTVESYAGEPIQISPKFIKTQIDSVSGHMVIVDNSNKNIHTDLAACTLDISNIATTINDTSITITYDGLYDNPVIVNKEIGISTLNGIPVVDGVITMDVSDTFMKNSLSMVNSTTQHSCINVKLPQRNLCNTSKVYYEYFDPRNRNTTTPVDVCFTVPDLLFKPERIDNIQFTHKKLQWHELEEV
jgi:hypothetical protein